jgi:trans-aconitate methyltransferase
MGGKGNAGSIVSTIQKIISEKKWRPYFFNFDFPYLFHDADAYRKLLEDNGFTPMRIELIPKVMSYKDEEGLAGWVRTTWLPYTERVPFSKRVEFIDLIVHNYMENHPPDTNGQVKVNMVRLEVEAIKS